MSKVRWILPLALILLIAACSSEKDQRYYPPIFGPKSAPAEPTGVQPAPKGFVGDPATLEFHRLDCPKVEKIAPSVRVYFAVPWDAVNAKYHPCEECQPLAGWK